MNNDLGRTERNIIGDDKERGDQMKQITIYEFLKKNKDILEDGWVAMDKNGGWFWYDIKPYLDDNEWWNNEKTCGLFCFNIAPFDGDWKDSLIKVEQ